MLPAELTALLEPTVTALGLEIDRTEVVAAGKRSLVRVFLDGDGPTGSGPSLEEITAATRAISSVLDGADLTRGRPYTLEVSSRGLSRPLTELRHFRRNLGRLVEFRLPAASLTGRLIEVTDSTLTVETETGSQELELAQVRRAVVQIEMNRRLADEEESEG